MRRAVVFFFSLHVAAFVFADGPRDNIADNVRRIPALGVEVPEAQAAEFRAGLEQLKQAIAGLEKHKDTRVRELVPDVQIFYNAVHDALDFQEFFKPQEIESGKRLLQEGLERARQLAQGEAPWTTQTGLVVRGYLSRIDGSAQPYGLVVPDTYSFAGAHRHRLDIWFHGRGETLSEVNFIVGRQRDRGQFTPADTIVLHPYGRYCNANKLAGEIDTLEALASVQKHYRIDDDRIAVRGFSMGGAACWQFAVHYADRWVGAAPGAGFSETPDFLKVFQQETLQPTWWEQKLWHMYDCTDYAINLFHCPTVAYSGEIDKQKQAADMMAAALAKERIDLVHIIGPKTAHSYHPAAKAEVDRRMSSIAARGRDPLPRTIHFTTWTLKYNRMHWVTIDALGEHWERARVDARIHRGDSAIEVKTANVAALTLSMPAGYCYLDINQPISLSIDGQEVAGPRPGSDRSWYCPLVRDGQTWRLGALPDGELRKRHDLQGPIDDAFMDSFVFVRPGGKCAHEAVEKWVQSEMEHAIVHWRQQFRGHARVKGDNEITDDDLASSNLVLWGDPQSNALLQRIADKLPIQWNAKEIVVGGRRFPADRHAPVLIYPNPLNSQKYVVVNSSFTYREYDYLNNARQVPKLPDWAIVDLSVPPDSRYPGNIVTADFFGERWELRPPRGSD
jgi:pimeloyl-ACP methyl ester carboxylesterase